MRNNLVWDWAGGYGTLIWSGSKANVINNFYSSPRSFPKNQKQALVVGAMQGSGEKSAAVAKVYTSGNYSADKLEQDINKVGNEMSPFPAPPVDTQEACTAARAILAGAGVRPLDAIDQKYLSAICCRCAREIPLRFSQRTRPRPVFGRWRLAENPRKNHRINWNRLGNATPYL